MAQTSVFLTSFRALFVSYQFLFSIFQITMLQKLYWGRKKYISAVLSTQPCFFALRKNVSVVYLLFSIIFVFQVPSGSSQQHQFILVFHSSRCETVFHFQWPVFNTATWVKRATWKLRYKRFHNPEKWKNGFYFKFSASTCFYIV